MTGLPEKHNEIREQLHLPSADAWEKNRLSGVFLAEENRPLDGTAPFTIHNPDGHYNAVIFHDSFMQEMVPLIAFHFENTTFIWRYSNAELIRGTTESCNPDIIIEEVVERFLVEANCGALQDEIPPSP
jgi:hypothetical protein